MDEDEAQREEELKSVRDRVIAALKGVVSADALQDVAWDEEVDAITAYDPKSEHEIVIAIDWG